MIVAVWKPAVRRYPPLGRRGGCMEDSPLRGEIEHGPQAYAWGFMAGSEDTFGESPLFEARRSMVPKLTHGALWRVRGTPSGNLPSSRRDGAWSPSLRMGLYGGFGGHLRGFRHSASGNPACQLIPTPKIPGGSVGSLYQRRRMAAREWPRIRQIRRIRPIRPIPPDPPGSGAACRAWPAQDKPLDPARDRALRSFSEAAAVCSATLGEADVTLNPGQTVRDRA
jgi:hypothetical protein